MKTIMRVFAVTALAPLLLTACGGGKNSTVSAPVVTTPAPSSFQSKFGVTFATTFNASSTANPVDPSPGDVPPLNLTAQPEDN